MKKQLLLFVMILLPMMANADPVEIDGIYYNLISKNGSNGAEVIRVNPNTYTGSIVIPETVTYGDVNYSVTSIGNYAFFELSSLISIIIPNSVTSIGDFAFYRCSGLTSISIPNSVTNICDRAFMGCSGLTSITIGNSVTSIGDGAFQDCSALTATHISDLEAWCKISFYNDISNPLYFAHHLYLNGKEIIDLVIPNSVTSIENYAFSCCSDLTSVAIPNSVKSIGEYVFANCSGLTSIAIPNSVTSIGKWAFHGCLNLTSVTIPNSVSSIENGVFCDCSKLTSVTIPNSVKSIGGTAFANCSGLTSVAIPNSVTNIGQGVFAGCSGLTSIIIPNSIMSIGNEAFSGCISLASVAIPNSVTSIGYWAFKGCSSLLSITIPNSVAYIDFSAFSGCSGLTSIIIGSGINSIGSKAFASCKELANVYCHAVNVPNTESDAFNDSYIDYATLHVPAESINAYKAADPWRNFKSVVSIEGGDTPESQKCEKPTINYYNGQLRFASATEGAEFVSEITDSDIKKNYEASVTLTVTYNISVFATKTGYDNSETATATLCWIDKEPTTEGITTGTSQIPAKAVLIQSDGGLLTIQGAYDGTRIGVYNINGTLAGEGTSRNGCATVNTNLHPGSVAIIKIGDRSVKVTMK